ncbi:MAG TPA: hypothetical protein DEB39_05200 [Planctomycetaceae bacterium]|nr:hypothetical protein [Planctomycetaceae bacterium]
MEHVYRPDRILGNALTELTPWHYHRWGAALGSLIPPGGKFLIGSDVRESSPRFRAGLIQGLCSAGASVVDLGTLPTTMVYYAMARTTANACAIVTGDDAPAEYNGLRWRIGNQPPCSGHFALFHIFEEEENRRNDVSGNHADLNGSECKGSERKGSVRTLDITFDYVAWYQETWFDTCATPLGVVVDPMHGSWAGKARRYLQAIFPHMLVSSIRDEPDPDFGGRIPSSTVPGQLEALSWEVDRRRADIGFAFDADGNRLTLIDGCGIPLQPEKTAWFLLDSFGDCMKGELMLHDAGCSEVILDRLRRSGVELLSVPRGCTSFWKMMRNTGACLGFETGGYYYFRGIRGSSDPLFIACWILDRVATLRESGMSFTSWRAGAPRFAITPELVLEISEIEAVMRHLAKRWKTKPLEVEGGMRLRNEDGWLYLRECRASNSLSVRIEAVDKKKLYALLRNTAGALDDAGLSGKEILKIAY